MPDHKVQSEQYGREKRNIIRLLVERMGPKYTDEEIKSASYVLRLLPGLSLCADYFAIDPIVRRAHEIAISGHSPSLRAALAYLLSLVRLETRPPSLQQSVLSLVGQLQQKLGIMCKINETTNK